MSNKLYNPPKSDVVEGKELEEGGALSAIREADNSLVRHVIQPIAGTVILLIAGFLFFFVWVQLHGSRFPTTLEGNQWIDQIGLHSLAISGFYFAVMSIRSWWVVFVPDKYTSKYRSILKILERILLVPVIITLAYILYETFVA